jgi:DNA-binding CsgD family transcriptional regulator
MGIPMRLQGSERFGGFLLGNGLDRMSFSQRFLPRKEEFRLFCLIVHRRIEELTRIEVTPPVEQPSPTTNGELSTLLDRLSPREREVILMLAAGRSRAQTAEACGISVHTVSDYAKIGYRKLGVHNRAEVATLLQNTSIRKPTDSGDE